MTDAMAKEKLQWNVIEAKNGCLEYQSYISPAGYPHARLRKKAHNAHRVAYILFKGEIASNVVVRHTCDNRKCVNPDHLIAGSQADNVRDCMIRGRRATPCGDKHPFAKLRATDIPFIKQLLSSGASQQWIASMVGVTQSTISKISLDRIWVSANS